MQHGELRADRCPRTINKFFQFDYKYLFDIVNDVEVQAFILVLGNQLRFPTETKNENEGTPYQYRKPCCDICHSG